MIAALRIGYPLWLARRRLRRRLGRAALVGAGIAIGAAVLALVAVGGAVIEDRSLARAVSALPPAQRTAQVSWYGTVGTGAGAWRPLDRLVRPKLRALGGEPVAVMLFHEASIRGRVVDLRAVDGVGRFVHLQSGRLPRLCVPAHCEVLRLAGSGPLPSTPRLRLVEVGRAVLPADAPFRDYLGRPPADTAVLRAAIDYHTPASPPLVLAEGVDGLSRTQELATLYRSYAWFLPVAARDVHPWSVDGYRSDVDRLRSGLATAPGGGQLDVTAPTDELAAAAARGRVSARRLLLVGGQAAALLLAFVVLAASTLRRDADAARRRLTWLGARGWQLALLPLAEAAAVAVAATVVGWCAGTAAGALAASAAGVPAEEAFRHSAASGPGVALAAGLAGGATLLLFAALRVAPRRRGATFGALGGLALGALVAIAIGLGRGGADTGALAAGGGIGGFLLLLPALVAFVAAVAAARLLAPLLRALERLGRRGPIAARLAALSLARSPGRARAAVAFLVVALGFALFAAVYRSTLAAGEREQAAYAVPADFVVSEDPAQLVPLNHLPEPDVAAGAEVTPVLRQTGDVSRLQASGGADVLGIPADGLPQIAGWRGDFAPQPLTALAAAIKPVDPVAIRTVPLPRGARTLELPLTIRGRPLAVRATIRLANGDYAFVRLGETPSDGHAVLRGPLPRNARSLLGLSFGQLNGGRRSANGGARAPPPPKRPTPARPPPAPRPPPPGAPAPGVGAAGGAARRPRGRPHAAA